MYAEPLSPTPAATTVKRIPFIIVHGTGDPARLRPRGRLLEYLEEKKIEERTVAEDEKDDLNKMTEKKIEEKEDLQQGAQEQAHQQPGGPPPRHLLLSWVERRLELKLIPKHAPSTSWSQRKGAVAYVRRVLMMVRCEDLIHEYLDLVESIIVKKGLDLFGEDMDSFAEFCKALTRT
ncbi:hypothetical protein DFH07DRAFT_967078 [Mycena maculata]|uniref:Uncharacterized protein n=1 Tax=Mycena maculata TaxID=230809 RepID=A0AAD7I5J0_9AGAR|nr:hypothetical protein DFH07DRAFT_967078 [Mycena maculata]